MARLTGTSLVFHVLTFSCAREFAARTENAAAGEGERGWEGSGAGGEGFAWPGCLGSYVSARAESVPRGWVGEGVWWEAGQHRRQSAAFPSRLPWDAGWGCSEGAGGPPRAGSMGLGAGLLLCGSSKLRVSARRSWGSAPSAT